MGGIYVYNDQYYLIMPDPYSPNNNVIKARVPYDIKLSEDCDKLQKWIYSHGWASWVSANYKCPWREPYGEFGYFEINGVKLKVPRKDLDGRFNTDIPDGKEHSLRLSYVYPKMSPASEINIFERIDHPCPNGSKLRVTDDKIPNYNIINIEIIGGTHLPKACTDEGICENYQSCKTKVYCDSVQAEYATLIHSWDERNRLEDKPEFEFIKKEFGMNIYRHSNYNTYSKKRLQGSYFYIKGNNPHEPEEWMRCYAGGGIWEDICTAKDTGFCDTRFYVLGKKLEVSIKMFTSNIFLPKHEELKKLVTEKVQSYIFN